MNEQIQGPRLENISFEKLSDYLKFEGWELKDTNYNNIKFFVEERRNTKYEIILNTDQSENNYESYLSNAINLLAEIKQIHPQIIARNIVNVDKDLHNIRIEEGSKKSIPIETAEHLIVNIKKILKESARIENKSTSLENDIEDYIKTCRFGHTWVGSFGISIESPLSLPNFLLDELRTETFPRRISKRISRGLMIVSEAIVKNSANYIVDNVEIGFNLKLCNAFLGFRENLLTDKFEYQMAWSPIIPIEEQFLLNQNVLLDRKFFSTLEKASVKFGDDMEDLSISFLGVVEGLKSPRESFFEEDGERFVIVHGISEETGECNLRIPLGLSDYKKAYEAHGQAKDVRVKCIVKKRPKGWEVKKVLDFKWLD